MTADEIFSQALALPDTEDARLFEGRCVRLRGKPILSEALREPGALVFWLDLDSVAFLLESQPDAYFINDHFRGYPAVMARPEALNAARVAAPLEIAWRRRATAAQRKARQAAAG